MATYPYLDPEVTWADKVNPDARPARKNCAELAVGPNYVYKKHCIDGLIVYEVESDWTTSAPNGTGGCDVEHCHSRQQLHTGERCSSDETYPAEDDKKNTLKKEWGELTKIIREREEKEKKEKQEKKKG